MKQIIKKDGTLEDYTVAEDGSYVVGGVSATGKLVVVAILAALLVISLLGSRKKEAKK